VTVEDPLLEAAALVGDILALMKFHRYRTTRSTRSTRYITPSSPRSEGKIPIIKNTTREPLLNVHMLDENGKQPGRTGHSSATG
jgi:hypothetical protein